MARSARGAHPRAAPSGGSGGWSPGGGAPVSGARGGRRNGGGLAELFFASGEEKTSMMLPAGYGYDYKASDNWVINYMLHNLLSTPDKVWIVYDLDFIPKSSPAAAK